MEQSAIGQQEIFDVCFNFSLRNDIMFNSKLFFPSVRLDNNILEYISQTKYLGVMFCTNAQDDKDI